MSKEDVIIMSDERITELEQALEKAKADHAGVMRMYENANTRYLDDTNILAGILYRVFEHYGLEADHLNDAIDNLAFSNEKIISVLQFHEAVPSELLTREYYVTVTVPVSVCVTVTATDPDHAEQMAADEVDCNGIDNYHMDYDLAYSAEYEVEEV
jgi:hypothetical protein